MDGVRVFSLPAASLLALRSNGRLGTPRYKGQLTERIHPRPTGAIDTIA
jgi:hypothetical protein